jgi:FtsP/CotA-like multicopper oxidase with cupredoxin domain
VSQLNAKRWTGALALLAVAAAASLLSAPSDAAAPGITGPTFNLTAQTAYLNQPDGASIYSWGYGCNGAPAGFDPPASLMPGANCPTMQVPGPTLIVTEGQTVTVNLTNNLPPPAGNTSILFPGFQVTATGGVAGLMTQEAAPGSTVTYTFVATSPGTRAYYSGSQQDLQIEMGLYGAIIVLPAHVPANCTSGLRAADQLVKAHWSEADYRLSQAAYDHPATCYDREYLFQFAEMDPGIHKAALAQVTALGACTAGGVGCSLDVPTEPYHPAYFLVNGRSMPDLMDGNYAVEYPHQPYNGNPHTHPGELMLLRIIGQGRWQHPFHEHANHVRILARDGNLIVDNSPTAAITYQGASAPAPALAGKLMFTTTTTPGQSMDGIFYYTGRGLNWDMYGHNPASANKADPNVDPPCTPDVNGYNSGFAATDTNFTGTPDPNVIAAVNFYEWCQDHNKPLEVSPLGDVPGGGPATLPNPNIFTNGAWYSGSPYLGPDATVRSDSVLAAAAGNSGNQSGCMPTATNPGATLNCSNFQPSNTQANPYNERGWAFMWHSHNEREITTNNIFPGGMFMMLLVDSREFVIDESN